MTRDTQAPQVEITSPTDGFITNKTSISIHWTVDGNAQITDTSVSLSEGENLIIRTATDAAGNQGADMITVICDTQAPVVSILSPENGFIAYQTPVAIHWAIDGVEQTVDTLSPLIEGINTIIRFADDAAGNRGSDTISVILILTPQVAILFPPDGFKTNKSLIRVSWTVNNTLQTTDTIQVLSEGINVIIRDSIDAVGRLGADTVTVLMSTSIPQVYITHPGKDTLVKDSILQVLYESGAGAYDTTIGLLEGINAVVVSHTDSFGNVGKDTLHVIYTKGVDSLVACIQTVDSAFSFQYVYINAKESKGPKNVPLFYSWRQLNGSPVCCYDSSSIITRILTRYKDTIQFELHVSDEFGILAPAYDTLSLIVNEPQVLNDFLHVLQEKRVNDAGIFITITSPSLEQSYSYSIPDDSCTFEGCVDSMHINGTIYWEAVSSTGIESDTFAVRSADWAQLRIPIYSGDNFITLVYTDDWTTVCADRIHISKSPVEVVDFEFNPDELWIDSLMNYTVKAKLRFQNPIDSIHLIKVSNQDIFLTDLFDNGLLNDSIADDSVFTGSFSLKPQKDSTYSLRLKIYQNDQIAYSVITTYYPQVPYSDSLYHLISYVNHSVNSMYDHLKSILQDSTQAMMQVVEWLGDQPGVLLAGINDAQNAICWVFECGIHMMRSDVPAGEKGSGRKKVKGLSPFYEDFMYNDDNFEDDGANPGNAYTQLFNESSRFECDVPLKNNDYNKPNPISIEQYYLNWDDYKVIIISSEGQAFSYTSKAAAIRPVIEKMPEKIRGSIINNPYCVLETRIPASENFIQQHWDDLTSYDSNDPYPRMMIILGDYVNKPDQIALTPLFFKKHCPYMKDALVYLSSCRSLLPIQNDFWSVFKNKGVSAFLGYTDYVNQVFAAQMGKVLFRELAKGRTIKYAMDCARGEAPGLGFYLTNGWPADKSDRRVASLFKYKLKDNDSSYTLYPTFHLINTEQDINNTVGGSVGYFNISTAYPSEMSGDIIRVLNKQQDTVLLRQRLDKILQVKRLQNESESSVTFDINGGGVPVLGNALYLSINSYNITDTYLSSPAVIIKIFLKQQDKTETFDFTLRYGNHLRNSKATNCTNAYDPTDITNSIPLYTPGPNQSFLDMYRINFEPKYWTWEVEKIKISSEELSDQCNGVKLFGGIRIQAASIAVGREDK
ncbi:MAG: hypothetical protein JW795_00085 [Chitinivibrionales bacterium]|nr:hypothetical protein [Chitinivibrionales bacterium]